jgi:predicted 3-demethylubiquinone-9 3-methyltransferase (glyoxalase superfamily)
MKKWAEKTPFPSESTKPGMVQQGEFSLDGCQFCAFDAGPMFKFNPSISFFAVFETAEEVDSVWNKLIEGGEALMPLDSYDWSERYGWVTDRFGLSWQLYKGKPQDVGQRITPLIMYSGTQRGNAEEAMNRYMSIFKNSSSDGVAKYGSNESGPEGMVKHAQCRLNGQTFMVMDNGTGTDIPFTEAISFYVDCKDQDEVDYFWDTFTEDGNESVCGWLKDKFGVSWQIVPEFFTKKMKGNEPEKEQKLMAAIYQMKKLDVAKLKEAYNQ